MSLLVHPVPLALITSQAVVPMVFHCDDVKTVYDTGTPSDTSLAIEEP